MSFGPSVSNVKLKAPDQQNGNYAVSALKALNRKGVELVARGDSLPKASDIASGHLQGVAVQNGRVLLTSSVGRGYIIKGRRNGDSFTIEEAQAVQASHPGGFQAIGSFFAVPVLTGEGSEIRFYKCENGIEQIDHLTICRKGRNATCVGITNCGHGDDEHYVLAVGIGKDVFDFYKSEPGKSLNDEQCPFELISSWNAENVSNAARSNWQPDNKWGGYGNNISLLADEAGNVYFLGLHRTGFLFLDFIGRDYADLFQLNLAAESEGAMLTKLANLHVKCRNGTGFRWGASATVISDDTFRIFACERNVQGQNNTTRIRLNLFHADHDSILEPGRVASQQQAEAESFSTA